MNLAVNDYVLFLDRQHPYKITVVHSTGTMFMLEDLVGWVQSYMIQAAVGVEI